MNVITIHCFVNRVTAPLQLGFLSFVVDLNFASFRFFLLLVLLLPLVNGVDRCCFENKTHLHHKCAIFYTRTHAQHWALFCKHSQPNIHWSYSSFSGLAFCAAIISIFYVVISTSIFTFLCLFIPNVIYCASLRFWLLCGLFLFNIIWMRFWDVTQAV